MVDSGALFDQLEHLWPQPAHATLAIEHLQDEPGRFGKIAIMGRSLSRRLMLGDLLQKG